LLPRPTPLVGHLRQEQAAPPAQRDEQAVLSDDDLMDVLNPLHGCQPADLDVQLGYFAGRHRLECEPRILAGMDRVADHRGVQRVDGLDVADAAAEIAAVLESHEAGPVLLQRLRHRRCVGHRRHFAVQIGRHGLPGELKQLPPQLFVEQGRPRRENE